MNKVVVLLLPLLAACASTHPPSCDGSNKRPINEPTAAVSVPPKTASGSGSALSGRWQER